MYSCKYRKACSSRFFCLLHNKNIEKNAEFEKCLGFSELDIFGQKKMSKFKKSNYFPKKFRL